MNEERVKEIIENLRVLKTEMTKAAVKWDGENAHHSVVTGMEDAVADLNQTIDHLRSIVS